MPNTLVHFGLQATILAGFNRKIALLWIYTGALLPDLPWISQRLIRGLSLPVDPYDLRLYCIAQSSLFFCVVLAAAIALVASRVGIVFAILAGNSLIHLLLDAWQVKWGNGVVLAAPFNWRVENWGIFWPESAVWIVLTIVAGICVVWQLFNWSAPTERMVSVRGWRIGLALIMLSFYLVGPLFVNGPAEDDAHYTTTLRNYDSRSGRSIEFDRVPLTVSGDGAELESFTGERIGVRGSVQLRSGTVSVKGTFVSPKLIEINDMHHHMSYWRDFASVLGLSLFAILVGFAFVGRVRT